MSTPIADMVERMLSAGMSADMVVLAVRTAEQCKQSVGGEEIERRRRLDRERKARKRAASGQVQPDTKPALTLVPSSSESQERKKEEKKERARGKICPPEFRPTPEHYEYGRDKGVPREGVDRACVNMRDWSVANANRAVARKMDWGRALPKWIDGEAKERKANGHRAGGLTEAKERLLARGAQFERQADPGGTYELPWGGERGGPAAIPVTAFEAR